MTIWNFIRSIADSLLGNTSSSAPPKSKKPDSSKPVSKKDVPRKSSSPEARTASVKVKVNPPQAKPVPKPAPPPPQFATDQAVVSGARTPFMAAKADEARISCRCIPEVPDIDNADLFIDLGIDFGTRYTKVCFRESDTNCTRIVTFGNNAASLGQALVPSQLAILDGGEILTGLTAQEWEASQWPITKTIDFIKMHLAALDIPSEETAWPPDVKELDSSETIENLSAFFLSRLIHRSRIWIQTNYPDLFKGRSVAWVLKVGAPVDYWQGSAIDRFEHVLKLAWALSFAPLIRGADMVTLPQLNHCMIEVREWIKQNPKLDCSAKPEIAGAVWSHIRAAGSREGFFIFFDVGEGTMEGASFRFYRESGENRISFYSSFVRPFGVAALTHQLAKELSIEYDTVREQLLSWSAEEKREEYATLHHSTKKQLQSLVARVIVRGCNSYKNARPYIWEQEIGSKLRIFMGGGGGKILLYRDAVVSTYDDFKHKTVESISPYDLCLVPVPEDLAMEGLGREVFNRFSIAYGLSIPDGEFPEFDLPVEGDAPSVFHNCSNPIPYEDTKDLC